MARLRTTVVKEKRKKMDRFGPKYYFLLLYVKTSLLWFFQTGVIDFLERCYLLDDCSLIPSNSCTLDITVFMQLYQTNKLYNIL